MQKFKLKFKFEQIKIQFFVCHLLACLQQIKAQTTHASQQQTNLCCEPRFVLVSFCCEAVIKRRLVVIWRKLFPCNLRAFAAKASLVVFSKALALLFEKCAFFSRRCALRASSCCVCVLLSARESQFRRLQVSRAPTTVDKSATRRGYQLAHLLMNKVLFRRCLAWLLCHLAIKN